MNFVKVISTELDKVKSRIVKVLRYGTIDVQTAVEAGPFGFDSNVPKDYVAIYAPTSGAGDVVIIGYINKNQLSEVGESRIYSTDDTGELKFYLHLKNDGTANFGGDADNLVRFAALEAGFNELKGDFNAFITHVHGVAGTPAVPPAFPSMASIADAKIEEIKTL